MYLRSGKSKRTAPESKKSFQIFEIEQNIDEISSDESTGINSENESCESSMSSDLEESNMTESDGESTEIDESTNEDEDANDDWLDVEKIPEIFDFNGCEGVKQNWPSNIAPFEAFSLIFDNVLVEKIVKWTNHKAKILRSSRTSRQSTMRMWKDTDAQEMKKFLGVCIVMGNVKMPSLRHYWATNFIYNHPFFGRFISRNRFEAILRCLSFYDNTDDTSNRLHKIKNVVEHIVTNIQEIYSPGRNLSLDEALLLWRGRLFFRQYIPNKAAKYGIKLYELSTPNGFILNILIYEGKGTVYNQSSSHAHGVVQKLMDPYLKKGHVVYIDNFYTSVNLAESLLQQKTHIVGTLRKNRKFNPKEVINKKLAKGESVWKRKGNVVVGKWKDKREVCMISTYHEFKMVNWKNSRGIESMKPNIIIDYNQFMAGVDRADQMMSYYSTPRKTVRWYIKLFFHLFDMCIWNSMIIFKKVTGKKISYLNFRDELTKSLLESNQNTSNDNMFASHYLKKISKRVRCRNCSKNRKRKLTSYICNGCSSSNKTIGLCPTCFHQYLHNQI